MADEVAIQPSLAPQATSNFLSNAQADQVWSDVNRAALIAELETLSAHGLEPAHYHLARLKTDDLTAAERDLMATDAWMSAAAHMLSENSIPSP